MSKLRNRLSFSVSLLLHAALLVSVALMSSGGGEGEKGEKEGGKNDPGKIVSMEVLNQKELQKRLEANDVGLIVKKQPKKKPKKTIKEKDCTNFFGGIGIEQRLDRVLFVYEGYPAYNAGIRPGDQIITHEEIRGEIGTSFNAKIISPNGSVRYVRLTRAKICMDSFYDERYP